MLSPLPLCFILDSRYFLPSWPFQAFRRWVSWPPKPPVPPFLRAVATASRFYKTPTNERNNLFLLILTYSLTISVWLTGQGSNMIGAMPAVAVRHERRRQEKRTKRPSLLYLQSPPSRSPTPSPLQSPPSVPCSQPPPEVYVCGKVTSSSTLSLRFHGNYYPNLKAK